MRASTASAASRRLARAACLACVLVVATDERPQLSAQAPSVPADVSAVLSQAGGATPDDGATLLAGRVIARTQVAPENLEASVVSAVRIATTRERTLSYFRQLIAYVDGQTTLQFGTFAQPATEADLRSLTLESTDIADFRACGPGGCDIRMGAATLDDVKAAVDWRAADVTDRASVWMRRTLASFVNDYRRQGDAALRAYDDRAMPVDLEGQWRTFVSRAPLPAALATGVQRYLATFPATAAPEATDEVYWDKQHLTGLKPVIGVTHLVTWTDPAHPNRVIVAQKQILASHYFFGTLAVTLIVQDPAADPSATYVVYTSRTRGDLLKGTQAPTETGIRARISGIGASVQRRAGEQLVRQSAERLLGALKEALER